MKIAGVLLAFLGGVLAAWMYFTFSPTSHESSRPSGEKQPLYWVAPMDPNYRRDEPGKSPMGMDLVPVYDEEDESAPGTIRISPDVINNIGVRTAVVQRRTLHNEIRTVGYVHFDENRLVHIHPRVAGWVDELYLKAAGDPVDKNQPLYALYAPHLVNAQEELLLAVNQGSERLIRAAEERLKALNISSQFIQNLRQSKQVKQVVTFYSAQNGVVDKLNIREGYYVQPGTTIMSIGDLSEVWVEAEIFERQSALVEVGLPVTMSMDYLPGRRWTGVVDYVYPTLDPVTRTVRVRLKFNNDDRALKPNMFAQVTIHANTADNRLVVPKEAVIRTGTQNRVVLDLGEGHFKSIAVRLGREHEQYWEILEGVEEGESIVTSAQFLMDSESAKTSDFKRMDHGLDQPPSVWASARVNELFVDQRRMNLTHEKVPEWEWPVMTMDLPVNENVDMDLLADGMQLHIEMTRLDDTQVEVSDIHVMENSAMSSLPLNEANSARVKGIVQSIDPQRRVLVIQRESIDKWNRPAAEVEFAVLPSIRLDDLQPGDPLDFTFYVNQGRFTVVAVHDQGAVEPMDHSDHEAGADHD